MTKVTMKEGLMGSRIYKGFRLVPKSFQRPWMTLNGRNVILAEIKVYGANRKKLNEDKPVHAVSGKM